MSMQTYDPKKVIVTFLGVQITGFDEDSFVTVERNEQAFTLKVGAGGDAARARSHNKSGKVTIRLLASSPSNDILTAAAIADEASGTGCGALMVKDGTGTSVASAANAWVQKLPSAEYGKEVGSREWVLESDDLEHGVGGTA